MKSAIFWIGFTLLALAVLNLWATIAITRDRDLRGRQKLLQLLVTWLLPVLGAVATLSVRHFASRHKDRSAGDSSLVVEDQHYISKGYF
jgi:hypothetical protein